MISGIIIKNKIIRYFKDNTSSYLFYMFAVIIGIIIGIILGKGNDSLIKLLKTNDENLFDFIVGNAELGSIFWYKLKDIIFAFLIIFVINLHYVSGFINYFFIGYQSFLFASSCSAILSLYGFGASVNICMFIVPINILFLFSLIMGAISLEKRAGYCKEYKLKFYQSFKNNNYLSEFVISFSVALAICIISSFIIPIFYKSFVFINY
ncbi:MAG: hypothetical protein RR334_01595 [Clostridia bacterium]